MLIKNSEENTMFIIGEGTAILSSASYPYTIEAEGNNGYTELGSYETEKERNSAINEIFVAYESNKRTFNMPKSTAKETNQTKENIESDCGLFDIFKNLMMD